MVKYPYTLKVSSLKDFFDNIPSIGTPERITIDFIESLGYKSKNDRAIVTILKFLGFADSDGAPTEVWLSHRDTSKSKAILAQALRRAYSELFMIYPDAQDKETEALRNFFSRSVTAGEPVLAATVNTFRALCEISDFGATPAIGVVQAVGGPRPTSSVSPAFGTQALTINLSIQLQLPATEDSTVYDKIFKSLRKHIFEQGE
jgi:hypothetical protein